MQQRELLLTSRRGAAAPACRVTQTTATFVVAWRKKPAKVLLGRLTREGAEVEAPHPTAVALSWAEEAHASCHPAAGLSTEHAEAEQLQAELSKIQAEQAALPALVQEVRESLQQEVEQYERQAACEWRSSLAERGAKGRRWAEGVLRDAALGQMWLWDQRQLNANTAVGVTVASSPHPSSLARPVVILSPTPPRRVVQHCPTQSS